LRFLTKHKDAAKAFGGFCAPCIMGCEFVYFGEFPKNPKKDTN